MKEVSNLIRKSYEGFEYISEDKVFPKTRTKRAFFNVQAILVKCIQEEGIILILF